MFVYQLTGTVGTTGQSGSDMESRNTPGGRKCLLLQKNTQYWGVCLFVVLCVSLITCICLFYNLIILFIFIHFYSFLFISYILLRS